MIDLFGLGKEQDPQEPTRVPAPEAPGPHGSHTLWAFLLVFDSVFVIVFAGAVAAKVYQYWKAPAPLSLAPRKHPVKAVRAVEAPVASIAPAPEPAKTTEPRPPKPSMLAEAPKHRETPRPADAAAVSPEADGKIKALRTEFKIHAPKAKAVELVGAFIVRGGHKDMARQDDGTWTVTLYLKPGSYRYFFSMDKKKQLDPENPHSERGASLLTIP